ncbi:MAG TPA: beta-propeller fold lactonase family protein [Tepidisphaeraceae bacterium]|jgi:6-phosphogluconolactonase (cycloisomerase 2 family)
MNRKVVFQERALGRDTRNKAVTFEILEQRRLLSANPFPLGAHDGHGGAATVYTESNNPAANKNAILAFQRNPITGTLKELPGGPYLTGGAGYLNSHGLLGPDDSDKEVIASDDGKLLFAVNQGSNSIAVFHIHGDGSLDLVNHHAFSSGGTQPVSLALSENRLYVVNRGNEVQGQPGTIAPNYTGFYVNDNGSLTPIPHSTVTLPVGLSPSQVLVSNDNRFLFGDNFTPPPLLSVAQANTIVPFKIGNNGSLTPAPSGPVGAPVTPPLILGLDQNPNHRIVYAGLVGAGAVGVYTYDSSGALTFVRSVPTQGGATCWLLVNADGSHLYVSDSATDTVAVFSLADPLKPVLLQEFSLAGPKSSTPGGANETVDFQLALDPTGRNLYVLNHQTALNGAFTAGNQIHTLAIGSDGTLSEKSSSPLLLPASEVPAGAHPQGLAIVATEEHRSGFFPFDFFSDHPVRSQHDSGHSSDDDDHDAIDRLH